MASTLLPPSASDFERAVDEAAARSVKVPVPIGSMWSPDYVPSEFLPYLAWGLSVGDEWGFARNEDERRRLVAATVELHRYKGTPYAIRRGMQLMGFRSAEIVEGLPAVLHNDEIKRNGTHTFAGDARWALFRVIADLGSEEGLDGEAIARIRRVIEYYKNARSHLYAISFRANIVVPRAGDLTFRTPLAVGIRPRSAKGVRDGRFRRGSSRRHQRDGEVAFNGAIERADRVISFEIEYERGRIYWRLPLRARFRFTSTRTPYVPRDGRLDYDGEASRGDAISLLRTPPIRLTRKLPRSGAFGRIGYGPHRDGTRAYDGVARGGRHAYGAKTREVVV